MGFLSTCLVILMGGQHVSNSIVKIANTMTNMITINICQDQKKRVIIVTSCKVLCQLLRFHGWNNLCLWYAFNDKTQIL